MPGACRPGRGPREEAIASAETVGDDGASVDAATARPAAPSRRARYVLGLLLAIYILNFLDRQVVNILAEPIKRDLVLSDTQIGLMTGLAFALLYTVLGFPLARYADRPGANRVGLIAGSLAVWSAMTSICGLAQTFGQLLAARVGVGIGEAGCTPAAHSLIADTVAPEKRPSAIAFYGLGIPIGSLLGLALGGVLNDAFGWRVAFMVVGAPGLLLAIVAWLTIKEPRHGNPALRPAASMPLRSALSELARSPTFVLLTIGSSVVSFLGYGKGVWTTILFIRDFGLSPGQAGVALGLVGGIAGAAGTWLGGVLAERFGRTDPRHILTAPAVGIGLAFPFYIAGYLSQDWRVALALLALPGVFNGLYYGPVFACVQGLMRPQARAMAVATVAFCQNLIGLGLGPLAFGMLSDLLRPMAGDQSVRWVLLGSGLLGLLPAWFFWRASLRLKGELDAAKAAGPAEVS